MFLTVHAAAATVIGQTVPQPFIAFVLGVISHFILDMIPHGDDNLGKKFFGIEIKGRKDLKLMAFYGIIDSFFLALFLLSIFKKLHPDNIDAVIGAIIGGLLPDLIMALYKIKPFKFLRGIYQFHLKNHQLIVRRIKGDIPLLYGVMMQICFMVLLVWLIYIA